MLISKNKNKIVLSFLLVVMLFLPKLALAATPNAVSALDTQIAGLFTTLNTILLFLQAFLWPILLLMGGLLNNDFLFSGGMQTTLLNIWTNIRDFVNIMFVLGLVFIAIINIIGGDNKYAPKAVLPKIVVALIAVNFSFLACKVILDMVNVGTTAIFAMPLASGSLNSKLSNDDLSAKICKDIMQLEKSAASAQKSTATGAAKALKLCELTDANNPASDSKITDYGKKFFETFNSRNFALVMAVELMNITDLNKLAKAGPQPTDSSQLVKKLSDLTINTLFSIVFFVIYATSFIALFVVLLARIIVLWISIALSPLSALGFAFEPVKSTLGENDPFGKLFMKHALAPLYVAVVLTIGKIMISSISSIIPTDGAPGGANLADTGSLISNMTTLQDLIAGFATAGFIWTAVVSVVKAQGGKGADMAGKIFGMVGGFAKSAAQMPLYAPILPTGGAPVGIAALGGMLNGPQKYIEEQKSKIAQAFGTDAQKDALLLESVKSGQEAKAAISKIVSNAPNNAPDAERQKQIASMIGKYESELQDLNYGKFGSFKKFKESLEAGKVTSNDWKAFMEANKGKGLQITVNVSAETQKAQKAIDEAKTVNLQVGTAENLQQQLQQAVDQNKPASEIEKAKQALAAEVAKLEKQTKGTKAITDLESLKVTDITPATATTPPKIKDQSNRTQLHTAYQTAKTNLGEDKAKELLRAQIKEKSSITVDAQLDALVADIIRP